MFSAWAFLLPTIMLSSDSIGDMIGPIIIFVVIITQIIRAARTFTKNKPVVSTVKSTKPLSRSPEEELRDFLGGLSGESKQVPATVPPPLSTAAPVHKTPPAVTHKSITILRRSAPKETPSVIHAAPIEVPAPVAIPVTKLEPMRTVSSRDLIRSDIMAALSTRQLLKQAIVLREVLGPPLGLRR
jgi:hypothetical protein